VISTKILSMLDLKSAAERGSPIVEVAMAMRGGVRSKEEGGGGEKAWRNAGRKEAQDQED